MSLIVLACDHSNLQIVNGIAECSNWIAVEHTKSFFEMYVTGTPEMRERFRNAIGYIVGITAAFFVAVYVIKRVF